jgi:hypothetical protein
VFLGYFQPVANTIWNSVQAGSAIPVKFSLNGNQGLNIFAANFPQVGNGSGCARPGDLRDGLRFRLTREQPRRKVEGRNVCSSTAENRLTDGSWVTPSTRRSTSALSERVVRQRTRVAH